MGFDDPVRPFPSFALRLVALAGVWDEVSTLLEPSLGLEDDEEWLRRTLADATSVCVEMREKLRMGTGRAHVARRNDEDSMPTSKNPEAGEDEVG